VGFLEGEFDRLERRIEHLDPPAYTPQAEVINLMGDEDDDIVIVNPVVEVRKWAFDSVCYCLTPFPLGSG